MMCYKTTMTYNHESWLCLHLQNCRNCPVNILIAEAQNSSNEKGTQEISSPTFCSKQGPTMELNQAAQGFIQLNVEKIQRGMLHKSLCTFLHC